VIGGGACWIYAGFAQRFPIVHSVDSNSNDRSFSRMTLRVGVKNASINALQKNYLGTFTPCGAAFE